MKYKLEMTFSEMAMIYSALDAIVRQNSDIIGLLDTRSQMPTATNGVVTMRKENAEISKLQRSIWKTWTTTDGPGGEEEKSDDRI